MRERVHASTLTYPYRAAQVGTLVVSGHQPSSDGPLHVILGSSMFYWSRFV